MHPLSRIHEDLALRLISAEVVFAVPVLSLHSRWHLVRLISLSCPRDSFSVQYHPYSIIGSLAGTSYFGPVAGHGLLSHDLEVIRMARKQYDVERSGTVGGEIEALAAPEIADSYVILKKKQHEEGKPEEEAGEKQNE